MSSLPPGSIGDRTGYAPRRDTLERRAALRHLLKAQHDPVAVHARIVGDQPHDPLLWQRLARDMGICAALVPEDLGGLGLTSTEFAMIAGELGAVLYGGPFWGSAVLALPALLVAAERSPEAQALVRRVAAGETVVALAGDASTRVTADESAGALTGQAHLVLDAAEAEVLCVFATSAGALALFIVDRHRVEPALLTSIDPTRPLYDVTFTGTRATLVADGDMALRAARDILRSARLAAAAEAVRGAEEALELSVEYAKRRTQFGRPIGVHQAVKHKCADGLIAIQLAKSVLAYAACALDDGATDADDAVLAAKVAATDGYVRVAADAIQIHGTYGYTRDALPQSYFRRARWLSLFLGLSGTDLGALAEILLTRADSEDRPAELFPVCMPSDDAPQRRPIRQWLEDNPRPTPVDLLDAGYMVPHWPPPFGLDADREHMLIIDQELRRSGVSRPRYPLARDFVAPLISASGSPEQQRYLKAMLAGDDIWCELFSEPEAGSDLASLRTTATRSETGYVVNGVKTWTSQAHLARYGLLLARTDPKAPKHKGISCFIVPMDAPGIALRPIESMEGERKWSTVYLDDVQLTVADRVGAENEGWRIALDVLANERMSMSSTPGLLWGEGPSFSDLLLLLRDRNAGSPMPEHLRQRVARGYVEALALHVMRIEGMGQQGYVNSVDRENVPEVRRALADSHGQDMLELWRDAHGRSGSVLEPEGSGNDLWARDYFAARMLTLGGGTSEIQRNILAERVLGLPRA